MRLIIYAPNVHQGGGKSLLLSLLHAAKGIVDVTGYFDERLILPPDLMNSLNIVTVKSSLFARLKSQYDMLKSEKIHDNVLCFGNLPPLFNLEKKVILFIQNRYLVDSISLKGFSFKIKMRILIERILLNYFIDNADEIVVQTPSMQDLIKKKFSKDSLIIPFVNYEIFSGMNKNHINTEKIYDFIYVATGEPQKNHINLLKAWKILANEGVRPSLALTLPIENNAKLISRIDKYNSKYHTNIINIENCDFNEVNQVYAKAKALIYPSKLESFGLPLLEAEYFNLPVIASELDYVRDVSRPVESFDPDSPISIARSVMRFMDIEKQTVAPCNAEKFIKSILKL